MRQVNVLLSGAVLAVGLTIGSAFVHAAADGSPPTSTQPATIDLQNTVCPVSGDKVGASKLTEIYNGRIYHFCCDDCPKEFKKNPEKFSKAVEADPQKYGVKQ